MSLLARIGRSASRGWSRYSQTVHTRGFAEAAESNPAKGLDVAIHGVEGRYALALFNAGAKSGALDGVTKDLAEVLSIASQSDDFTQFLGDPSVAKKTKREILSSALAEINATDVSTEFFGVLADNNRLSYLPKIAQTYDQLVAASRGEVTAKVTLAEDPEDEVMQVIQDGLKSMLKPGQDLQLDVQVDPVIIGGMIIEVGDKRVDLSILSRVKKIQQLLRETL